MRVLVVDDRSDVRRGREAILRDAGIDTVGLDFHAALFEPVVWSHFDRVLLDARDDSPYPTQIGNTPDRFLGPRVAERIASEESAHKPVVILVSLHVRENEWLAARCAESGVDYTYDQRDLLEESHWLQVVTHPEAPGNAVELGRVVLSRRRGIARAIDEVETSEAGPDILFGERSSPYEQRNLRKRLTDALGIGQQTGERTKNASARELRQILLDALGLTPRDYGVDS
ncbi:MAG: hypothetical protein V9E81_01855 [Marmoricola sp.]